MRELEGVLGPKKPDEVVQILGELATCGAKDCIPNAFWLLEHYVLARFHDRSLRPHYPLLAKMAAAFTSEGADPVVQVCSVDYNIS